MWNQLLLWAELNVIMIIFMLAITILMLLIAELRLLNNPLMQKMHLHLLI